MVQGSPPGRACSSGTWESQLIRTPVRAILPAVRVACHLWALSLPWLSSTRGGRASASVNQTWSCLQLLAGLLTHPAPAGAREEVDVQPSQGLAAAISQFVLGARLHGFRGPDRMSVCSGINHQHLLKWKRSKLHHKWNHSLKSHYQIKLAHFLVFY